MQQPAVVTQVEQVLSPYTMQSHIDNMNVAANSITPNIQNEIGMSQNVAVNETELKPIIFVDTAPLTETDYEQLFPLIKEKGSNIICIDICLPYCADQCVTLRTANNSSTLQGQSGSIPEPQLPTQSVTRELQSWQQQRLQMGGSQNQQMQDVVYSSEQPSYIYQTRMQIHNTQTDPYQASMQQAEQSPASVQSVQQPIRYQQQPQQQQQQQQLPHLQQQQQLLQQQQQKQQQQQQEQQQQLYDVVC